MHQKIVAVATWWSSHTCSLAAIAHWLCVHMKVHLHHDDDCHDRGNSAQVLTKFGYWFKQIRVQIKIEPRFFLEDKKLLEKKNDGAIFCIIKNIVSG